jgi:hypothetical protein
MVPTTTGSAPKRSEGFYFLIDKKGLPVYYLPGNPPSYLVINWNGEPSIRKETLKSQSTLAGLLISADEKDIQDLRKKYNQNPVVLKFLDRKFE